MNNDNFMVFVYNAIIALFAFFVAAPMLLNAISLFTVQKRFAKVMVDEGVVKEETVRRLHPKKQVAGVLISLLVLAGLVAVPAVLGVALATGRDVGGGLVPAP